MGEVLRQVLCTALLYDSPEGHPEQDRPPSCIPRLQERVLISGLFLEIQGPVDGSRTDFILELASMGQSRFESAYLGISNVSLQFPLYCMLI